MHPDGIITIMIIMHTTIQYIYEFSCKSEGGPPFPPCNECVVSQEYLFSICETGCLISWIPDLIQQGSSSYVGSPGHFASWTEVNI